MVLKALLLQKNSVLTPLTAPKRHVADGQERAPQVRLCSNGACRPISRRKTWPYALDAYRTMRPPGILGLLTIIPPSLRKFVTPAAPRTATGISKTISPSSHPETQPSAAPRWSRAAPQVRMRPQPSKRCAPPPVRRRLDIYNHATQWKDHARPPPRRPSAPLVWTSPARRPSGRCYCAT